MAFVVGVGEAVDECFVSAAATQFPIQPPHNFQQEEEKEDGGQAASASEGEEEEEGEVLRPLGGFERFFGTFQSMGLGLIYFIADVEGPVNVDVSAWLFWFCVWWVVGWLAEAVSHGRCNRLSIISLLNPPPPPNQQLLQRAMRMQVKRHPNLRSVLVQG